MNCGELKEWIVAEAKRTGDTTVEAHINKFLAEGEARIATRLSGYDLVGTLVEADRNLTDGRLYFVDFDFRSIRSVRVNEGAPLDEIGYKEAFAADYGDCLVYGVAAASAIIINGAPPVDAEIQIDYFGRASPLVEDTDTNKLLDDYPHLYRDASQVSLYKFCRDYEAAQAANQAWTSTVEDINKRMRDKMGGKAVTRPRFVYYTRSEY